MAQRLEDVISVNEKEERIKRLNSVIRPYIEIVEPDQICQFTGLKLQDIWRYFRHTWTTSYKSLPGRTVNILIRDAAAPNHPVIGIAALGSSIIQQSRRDDWIGWSVDTLVTNWTTSVQPKRVRELLDSVDDQIGSIYIQDFKDQGLISNLDISYPREKVISKLIAFSEKEKQLHQANPQSTPNDSKNADWLARCQTHLFKYKRSALLADLLKIRFIFQKHSLGEIQGKKLRSSVSKPEVAAALGKLLKLIKSENVGIHMMDIVVCGALDPYRAILGGKLVCMLLASPEISQYYNNRYASQVSVIASSIKGSAVTRKPQLSLLCTTSLYGSGSSQYNRVNIPLNIFGKNLSGVLKYEKLGKSEGFGSFHFSSHTNRLINEYQTRNKGSASVNNIFGEGVNPMIRKLRQGLSKLLGIGPTEILRHKSSRILYGVALSKNFREVLSRKGLSAKYLIPQSNPLKQSQKITKYWISRWLDPRIFREGVIQSVSEHDLSHPINHGARPIHYKLNKDEMVTFDFWDD